MANYCLDENGTAANKAAALNGAPTDLATCMNVAVHNAEAFSASDVIQLSDNNEITTGVVPPTASVRYTAYPGDDPIINPGAATGIDVNVAGLEIDNIEFKGGGTAQLDANNALADNLIVHDCHFNSPNTFGVYIRHGDNAEIYDCTGEGGTEAIIYETAGGTGKSIHDNVITGAKKGIATGGSGTLVYGNTITECTAAGGNGIQVLSGGTAKIYGNLIYLANTFASIVASTYGIAVNNGGNPEVYNNKCYYCYVGFRTSGVGLFHHNLAFLNGTNGFDATVGSVGAEFYNNDSLFNNNHQFVQQSGGTGAIFKNNIGWCDGTVPSGAPNTECFAFVQVGGAETVTVDYNTWIITNPGVGVTLCRFNDTVVDNKETELSDWQTLCAAEADISGGDVNSIAKGATVGIDETTVFTDVTIADRTDYDFSLKKGSPCIQVGDNAVWSGTANITDYIGTSITDGAGTIDAPGGVVDMGAYEYVAVPVVAGINMRRFGLREYRWGQYAKP